jgi:LDH2 family malate/lactate/ureidoglycolate dehydrogenase
MSGYRVFGNRLQAWASSILRSKNVPEIDAECVAEVLVAGDLRGVTTHGVLFSLKHYVDRIERAMINLTPQLRTIRESAATILLDGDNGFGHVAARHAMRLAMQKALDCGIGVASVANSTHLGMLGYYPLMAATEDLVGIALTSTAPTVVPTFGVKPMIGTNPISVSAPASKHPPFIMDFATSVVAGGKVQVANLNNVSLPQGWMVDKEEKPLTDASLFLKEGFLLPLGGDQVRGSHKGYGLALAVDILCGVLSGSGYGAIMVRGQNYHFLGALNISAFQAVEDFKATMDRMIEDLHSSPKAPGQSRIYVPGEIEHETYLERSVKGIPIPSWAVSWIEVISASTQLALPWED